MVVFHHQARRAARLFGQASLWVLAASAAWAADPAPNPAPDPVSGGMLEEIVVTAQKRSESLQDTPISITARSEEHTSELQSLMRNSYAVFCLKKKQKHTKID